MEESGSNISEAPEPPTALLRCPASPKKYIPCRPLGSAHCPHSPGCLYESVNILIYNVEGYVRHKMLISTSASSDKVRETSFSV
jgi:hypothetical protein